MAVELGAVAHVGVWIVRLLIWGRRLGGRMYGWLSRRLLPRMERAIRIDRQGRDPVLKHDFIAFDVVYDNYLGRVELGEALIRVESSHGDAERDTRLPTLTEESGSFKVRVQIGPEFWHTVRHRVRHGARFGATARFSMPRVQPWDAPWEFQVDLKVWRRDLGFDDPLGPPPE